RDFHVTGVQTCALPIWIVSVMEREGYSYEILFIDDGSTDGSWKMLESLAARNPNVKALHFHTNYGKSQALHAGFARAQGDVVIKNGRASCREEKEYSW